MNGRESSLSTPAIPSLVYFASGFITAIASVSLMGYMTKKSLKSTIKKSEPRSHEFYSKSHEKERLVDGQLESRTAKRREDFSDSDRNTQQKQKEAPSFSASEDDKIIIDTPYLSHRIIRKAEAVIRFRTSRFLVVIERCTDDHNYSAILRTVEALGIQHVWIVSPPLLPYDWHADVEAVRGAQEEHDEGVSVTCGHRDSSAQIAADGLSPSGAGFVNSRQASNSNASDGNESMDKLRDIKQPTSIDPKENSRKLTVYRGGQSGGQTSTVRGHNISQSEILQRVSHHVFAKRATDWLTIREFQSTTECIQALRDDDRTIWATDLSQTADCLTSVGLTVIGGSVEIGDNSEVCNNDTDSIIPKRLAIVFGTEAVGCTMEMLSSSDRRVYLPLRGFADSLNLSVATALCILQLFHLAPSAVSDMSEEERHKLRKVWFAKIATQRLISGSEKKKRQLLRKRIQDADEIERRRKAGNNLSTEQRLKLLNSVKWRAELIDMELSLQRKAELTVQDWVDNPPSPLSDMRRADEHRICYVGARTKKKYAEDWKDLPATTSFGVHGAHITCKEFCDKAQEVMDKVGEAENFDSL